MEPLSRETDIPIQHAQRLTVVRIGAVQLGAALPRRTEAAHGVRGREARVVVVDQLALGPLLGGGAEVTVALISYRSRLTGPRVTGGLAEAHARPPASAAVACVAFWAGVGAIVVAISAGDRALGTGPALVLVAVQPKPYRAHARVMGRASQHDFEKMGWRGGGCEGRNRVPHARM
jgi:hypothetical protein